MPNTAPYARSSQHEHKHIYIYITALAPHWRRWRRRTTWTPSDRDQRATRREYWLRTRTPWWLYSRTNHKRGPSPRSKVLKRILCSVCVCVCAHPSLMHIIYIYSTYRENREPWRCAVITTFSDICLTFTRPLVARWWCDAVRYVAATLLNARRYSMELCTESITTAASSIATNAFYSKSGIYNAHNTFEWHSGQQRSGSRSIFVRAHRPFKCYILHGKPNKQSTVSNSAPWNLFNLIWTNGFSGAQRRERLFATCVCVRAICFADRCVARCRAESYKCI